MIAGDPEFFAVTKRLHNHLHGAEGDAGGLGAAEREIYERTLAAAAAELAGLVHPSDIVILHDPQTAGLVQVLRQTGAVVIWRCHVGVDQLYNYIAELAAYGLELAGIRARHQDTNARIDLDALQRMGVIGGERTRRLQRLRELRRLLVHEYATATAEQVHEAALIVSGEFIAFYDAYRAWIARGFSPNR